MLNRLRLFDWTIVVIPLLLILIGVVVIYTVTFPTVGFNLARSQIIFALLGLVTAAVLTFVDYRTWQNMSYLFYSLGMLLLISVFFIGSSQFGAARWIDFGFFQLQPSEIFKVILILIMAKLLSMWAGAITIPRLLIIGLVAAIPTGIVFKQPDLGTASVLVAITFGMLIFTKLPWKWWLTIAAIIAVSLPIGYNLLEDYQKQRIATFMSPEADPGGTGYNVRQATIAIGSGGLLGQGLGRGSQSQLNFLPVAHTDFIFAGLAEATGFIGASVLLILYLILVSRIFRIAELAKDSFGMYVALGMVIMIGFQVVVNVGMNLALLPVTGIPLPFVSSGGTSLIITMAGIGILQSIYIRHKKITF